MYGSVFGFEDLCAVFQSGCTMCPPPAVHEGSESCTPLARAAPASVGGDRVQQLQARGWQASCGGALGGGSEPLGCDWQWVGMGTRGGRRRHCRRAGERIGRVWREQTVGRGR